MTLHLVMCDMWLLVMQQMCSEAFKNAGELCSPVE